MLEIKENLNLKNFSNIKIGGKARYFAEINNELDLIEAVEWWINKKNLKVFILGGGNNIMFSPKNIRALFLKINLKKIIPLKDNRIYCQAGAPLDKLLNFFFKNSLSGIEWAGGLPGTLGGAIRGNAGAFGGEMKDSIEKVFSLEVKNGKIEIIERKNKECNFCYRTSIFKQEEKKHRNKNLSIIIGAVIKAKKEKNILPFKKIAQNNIKFRWERHPMNFPTLGSTFKNIPTKLAPKKTIEIFKNVIKKDPFSVIPVAAILDKLNFKNKTCGNMKFSEKHPNFMINTGNGNFFQAKKLISLAKNKVKNNFGIDLEEEIEIFS